MTEHMIAQTTRITGADDQEIDAYLAVPSDDEQRHGEQRDGEQRGGVVVIHHMPGYDRGSKEITRRFAELGYNAICPNLHYRDAPGASPDDAAAAARANG
ncbi:MAG: dienelactone hydrolase family protein, partial [Actinomycetota bacterium]|nr:dienelactone hydrolase family protein [Actinomycetota bacterium]